MQNLVSIAQKWLTYKYFCDLFGLSIWTRGVIRKYLMGAHGPYFISLGWHVKKSFKIQTFSLVLPTFSLSLKKYSLMTKKTICDDLIFSRFTRFSFWFQKGGTCSPSWGKEQKKPWGGGILFRPAFGSASVPLPILLPALSYTPISDDRTLSMNIYYLND